MIDSIYPIVEGHGEVKSVPIILRRILHEKLGVYDVHIFEPYRMHRGNILKAPDLKRVVNFAGRKLRQRGANGAVVLLFDADDDCAARLGPQLRATMQEECGDLRNIAVLAVRELEAWFLTAAPSLRGLQSVRRNVVAPPNPETISDAKGFVEREIFVEGAVYSSSVDQPELAARFDINMALTDSSFEKLYREVADAAA